jgi:hypothetical protein
MAVTWEMGLWSLPWFNRRTLFGGTVYRNATTNVRNINTYGVDKVSYFPVITANSQAHLQSKPATQALSRC